MQKSDVSFLIFSLLVLIGNIAIAASDFIFAWDGSYYFFETIHHQTFFLPHERFINIILQSPSLYAASVSNELLILKFIFSLSYTLPSVISLWLGWYYVRNCQPNLILWQVLALCLATQRLSYVSEAVLSLYLAFPLILALLTDKWTKSRVFLLLILSFLIAISHPYASFIFLLLAALAALNAVRSSSSKRANVYLMTLYLALTVFSYVPHWLMVSDYESQRLGEISQNLGDALWIFCNSYPAYAWSACLCCGVLLLLQNRRPSSEKLKAIISIILIIVGLGWIIWLSNPLFWPDVTAYKVLIVVLILPFAAFAFLESRCIPAHEGIQRFRTNLIILIGYAYLAAQLSLSFAWSDLAADFSQSLETYPQACIPQENLSNHLGTVSPFYHWSVSTYSLIIQGQEPDKIVLPGNFCLHDDLARHLPYVTWQDLDWESNWFILQKLRENLALQGKN